MDRGPFGPVNPVMVLMSHILRAKRRDEGEPVRKGVPPKKSMQLRESPLKREENQGQGLRDPSSVKAQARFEVTQVGNRGVRGCRLHITSAV